MPRSWNALLNAGADPNGTAHEGQTMLMTAALAGKPDAVRLLLTRGATVDAIEPYKGQTALMWAAAEGQYRGGGGADRGGRRLKRKSTGGFTPLLFAVRNAHIQTTEAAAEARRQRQRRRAGRIERARHGRRSMPTSSSPRCCSIAAPIRTCRIRAARRCTRVAWLRKPGADGAAGVGNTPQGTPPVRRARSRRSSSRRSCWRRARIRTPASSGASRRSARKAARRGIRRTSSSGTAPSQLHRRHALLCRREERRRAADASCWPIMAPIRRCRRRPASRR